MEWRLYYAITWPAGLLTTLFGYWLVQVYQPYTLHFAWMHAKLALVGVVWVYHLTCGHYLRAFARAPLTGRSGFFRVFNEMPTILLIAIVLLVVVKPVLIPLE
jgi:putative membrane protein